MSRKFKTARRACGLIIASCGNLALADTASHHLLIIRAAHLIEVDSGKVVSPAEVLVEGARGRSFQMPFELFRDDIVLHKHT